MSGKRQRYYIARIPTRGHLTVGVWAESVADAAAKINARAYGETIEWTGLAQDVRLGRVSGERENPS